MPDYIGSGGVVNPIFQRAHRRLAAAGNGAPTLRFGGDSTDHTWWNPTGAPKPTGIATDLNPDVARPPQRSGSRPTRTPLVLGLNMGLDDPGEGRGAGDRAARASLPPHFIRNFELGNEPDLYATPRAYAVGRNVRPAPAQAARGLRLPPVPRARSTSTSPRSSPAAPDVGLSGGGFASGAWDDLQDAILSAQPSVRMWSAHAYPLQTCDKDVRRRGGAAVHPEAAARRTRTSLDRRPHAPARRGRRVARRRRAGVGDELGDLRRPARRERHDGRGAVGHRRALRPRRGRRAQRRLPHRGPGSLYGADRLRARSTAQRSRRSARSSTRCSSSTARRRRGSKLLAVGPNAGGARLKTWGTIDRAGTRRFVVDQQGPPQARPPPRAHASRRASRATSPSSGSSRRRRSPENNVTFGGRGWGGTTADGKPKGKRVIERVRTENGQLRLIIPRASAALITVKSR